jgi:predicted nucleotidyltransferase
MNTTVFKIVLDTNIFIAIKRQTCCLSYLINHIIKNMLTNNLPSAAVPLSTNLALVCQIILEKLQNYSVQIYLFGSQARGNARPTSDIDVAILPKEPLPMGLLAEVREALFDSVIPVQVDLVDLSQAEENFKQQILREAIEWKD